MDVRAIISVGSFTAEAWIEDCGPDALGDAFRQVTTHTMAMLGGAEGIMATAAQVGAED